MKNTSLEQIFWAHSLKYTQPIFLINGIILLQLIAFRLLRTKSS